MNTITIPIPDAPENKCPFCLSPLIYPRGGIAYCEECGYPDEVRAYDYEASEKKAEQRDDLLGALEYLVECSPCQNDCDPSDMSCATNRAKAVIARVKGDN